MRILAIEDMKLHITDERTRQSMEEVLSCFYSGCLRSSVVMLYSTVLSDVYYKLVDLIERYDDHGAKQIIDNIRKSQEKSDRDGKNWEILMLKECKEKNKVLTREGLAHLDALRMERNMCAHPRINGIEEGLYCPNSAKVQGLIVDMMSEILCKPSFLSKDFLGLLLDDLSMVKEELVENKKVMNYIQVKYLNKIDNPLDEYILFKNMWKFVFQKKDDKSSENRHYNNLVLSLLLERNDSFFIDKMRLESDYYGNNVNVDDSDCLSHYINFLNKHHNVYEVMPDDFIMRFKSKIGKDPDLSAKSFFNVSDIDAHIKGIEYGRIKQETIIYIFKYLQLNVSYSVALDFAVKRYCDSFDFDNADFCFDSLVKPNLNEFTEDHFGKIISAPKENSQILNRRRYEDSFRLIKETVQKRFPDFVFSE